MARTLLISQLFRASAAAALIVLGCAATGLPGRAQGAPPVQLRAEVWADNWFAFHVGDKKVAEDPVSIRTERSFNAETFTFEAGYPFEVNLVIRDYIEDDTGLEYIGARNQQMGDGGFIMQLTDTATGRVVAVSSPAMRCLVVHQAPLNPDCEKSPTPVSACRSKISPEPAGWKSPGFDASSWQAATVYSESAVKPRDGFTRIRWDKAARLVWSSDLKADNTLLCKLRVDGR